jgi:HSP20 family molecular chaperone IbpA
MSALSPMDGHDLFPDLYEWLESSRAVLPARPGQPIRTEDYIENGRFVVRAEMPGIDPDREARISVSMGIMTIHAHRHEDQDGQRRSEFRYGSFTRHVALPVTADESDVRASYHQGIIEVSVGLRARPGNRADSSMTR